MLYSAQQQGHTGYLNWFRKGGFVESYDDKQMYAQFPNAYSWYFKQPMFEYGQIPPNNSTWTWEIDGSKFGSYNLMSQPLSVIKEFYKKNLIFNEETNRRGQLLVDKYGIDFSKTIGCTWRGGDIYLESLNGNEGRKYTPIEFYFEWIDKALEAIPDARIACTSEEDEILDPLFKRYGEYVCFIDDDDSVSENYIEWLLEAIESGCDCASLRGVITTNGGSPEIFEHSLKYPKWRTTNNPIKYERGINHLNLVKASIAKQFKFPEINHGEDHDWATQLQKSGLLKTEFYIPDVIYFYKYLSNK